MPIASTDDQRALAGAVRSWGDARRPVELSRAQEDDPASWRSCWDGLADLGAFAIAVPEPRGGAGGTPTDLAVLLEQAADLLVPGPLVPSALAAVLLARSDADAAWRLLPRLTDGSLPAAVALEPGSLTATDTGDELVLTGEVSAVAGATEDSLLLLCANAPAGDRWFVVEPGTAGLKLAAAPAADFSQPLADVHLDGVRLAAGSLLPDVRTEVVRDLAATLFAAEAAGVAGWALRTAVEYAKVREQFGKPIGSFQAVKHLCAEMLCRVELATALAWDAAEAADDGDQRPVASAVAASLVFDLAVETAKDCIQVLGGIGFTWEHDAHLYLRRALTLRARLGGSAGWRRRLADLTLEGRRRRVEVDLGDVGQLRGEVRAVAEEIARTPAERRRAALVDAGYLTPHWPRPYGLDAAPVEQLVIDQELARAGVDRPDLVIAAWAIPTILQYGSPEQIERFVRPTLLGEVVWCQLFSEPGAGSDLASLRTRAEAEPGRGWRLFGQKVWTSAAHNADWGICLARTYPDAAKHKGISYFLVDMRSPGIEIRPLREITGEELFNEVFFDGAFVPEDMLVGELNQGWTLARATLVNERLAMGGGSSIGDAVERLLALAAERGATDDPAVRERLGKLVAEDVAGTMLELRSTLRRLGGASDGSESSVRKLVGVRHRQAVAEAALELLGSGAALDSEQLHEFLMTRCLTIAGGTSQVLLTLAAERLLGLPRG